MDSGLVCKRPIADIRDLPDTLALMTRIDLNGLEAARQLAALSPQTQHRFDEALSFGWTGSEQVTQAFRAIGSAIASKRQPVSDTDKKKLFAFAERLLKQASPEVSNAVATCMVGQIWTATRESAFDFSLVDPYLGSEARRYAIALDDFHKTKTIGLTR